MIDHPDELNHIWGARISSIDFQIHDMRMVVDLFWTEGPDDQHVTRRLVLSAMTRWAFKSDHARTSEVVELIAVEAKRQTTGDWFVWGEFSNYEFEVVCGSITLQAV
jgi:hypothetical protein